MIARLCIVSIVAIGAMLALRLSAKAHEAMSGWSYPLECCAGYDCAEISETRVKISSAGYVIDGQFTVPYRETRHSPDGRYHACFPKPDKIRCFFAPSPGS